jgi:hypothetical protein
MGALLTMLDGVDSWLSFRRLWMSDIACPDYCGVQHGQHWSGEKRIDGILLPMQWAFMV